MKKSIIFLIVTLFFSSHLFPQTLQSMEFHNQKITDILLAIAEVSGVTIIPDETVDGYASFYFSEADIDTSLPVFLGTYNLYCIKENKTYRVSRINSAYNKTSNLVSIKADNTKIEHILRNLSSTIGKTILYDTLPELSISVDIDDILPEKVLEICVKRLPDFQIESTDEYFYVKKSPKSDTQSKTENSKKYLTRSDDSYSLSLEKGRFLDILTTFFKLSGREYSLFVQSDLQLENLYFANKDFLTMLTLILEQGSADYILKDDIFYIVDIQKKNISTKLRESEIIPLTWISAADITTLVPADLSSSASMRVDKGTNSLILTGTKEELEPLKRFISLIDVPSEGMESRKIDIKYMDAKEVLSLIPAKIVLNTPMIINGTNSILATGTKDSLDALLSFISQLDIPTQVFPITLKYLQVDDLLKAVPPSINSDLIVDSGYPNIVFFKGSPEKLELFKNELEIIDRPIPQIRYQLLVIQYIKNDKKSNRPQMSIKKIDDGVSPSFIYAGSLTNVLDLSFDIISQFGFDFATALNSQIEENTANIFTDTTLTALSGQEVKFQNTDTYRYMQYDYDSSSNTKSGTTQSITSGLLVGLNGWSSGDDMITMTVNATISKQNSVSSSNSKTTVELPSTSERVITTQVRAASGEPVIISGLIKEDESQAESRIPIISKIPLIGNLFKQTSKSKEKTEIVIYIVPHLIQDYKGSTDIPLSLEHYYKTLIGNENVLY